MRRKKKNLQKEEKISFKGDEIDMFFLDTTFLIDVIQNQLKAVSMLKKISDSVHLTGSINVHEFLVGGYGAKFPEKEIQARKIVLRKLIILPFDEKSAEESAIIESNLRNSGEMIGTADILIAGIMKANGIKSILTNNFKHFEKIEGIDVISY